MILKVQDASPVFPSLSVHAFWCACVCQNAVFQSSTQRPLQDAEMLGVRHAHINLPEDRLQDKPKKKESAPLVKTSRTRACEIHEKEAQILPPSFCLFGGNCFVFIQTRRLNILSRSTPTVGSMPCSSDRTGILVPGRGGELRPNPDRHKSCAPISSMFVRALVSTVIPNTNGTRGKD